MLTTKDYVERRNTMNELSIIPKNGLELMAYGDFLIETCHVSTLGAELVLKQQFCKKNWNA